MTQLFANGFESGDFSSWTGNYTQNGTSQVQSSIVNSGSYAGQFTVTSSGGYADVYKNLSSSYTTVNQRFYVRFNTLPASGEGVLLGFLANNSTNNTILGIGLRYSGGSAKWFVGYLKAGSYTLLYSSANTPQTNTWYCLEVKAVINASSGTVEAWINGTKDNGLCDTSGFNNTAWGNINRAFVGQDSQTEPTYPLTTYVDDVVVADTYIGPLGGSASKLAFTAGASQSVTVGSVSSVITVQVQDSSGNPVTTGATVGLSTSSTGGSFYSDSGGSNQITSIVITSGQSSADFYYKDTTTGTPTLTASSTGLTSATTQFTINQSGTQFITSIASGEPFTVSSGALSLNISSPLQVSSSTLGMATANLNGTANQVNVSGGTGAIIGSGVTLSLPQNIDTGASPTFTGLTTTGSIVVIGDLNLAEGTLISNDAAHIQVAGTNALMLPTQWYPNPIRGYTDLGYGNILFKHTGSQHDYPDNVYSSLFLIMVQDPNPSYSNNYYPMLATDHGLWVEKDIQTYGALFTGSDPGKSSGGGAILMGHGMFGATSDPQILLMDTIGGGTGATATLTVNNGVITAINVTNQGSGYTFADVSVTTTNGSGARLAPVISNEQITSINIYDGGSGYSSSDTIVITNNPHNTLYLKQRTSTGTSAANLDLSNITINGYSQINWNTSASNEWDDLGSIRFNNINDPNHVRSMELKGTVEYFGGSQLLPKICMMYLDPDLTPDPWVTTHEFRPNGDTKIWGTLLYHGSLVHFDYMDDFAALRAIKTTIDGKGRTVHDPETLKFLQDGAGFYTIDACIGWELSIQQKFLQEIDSLKTEIASLKEELIILKEK